MLPAAIHPDVKSRAERRIYDKLQASEGTGRWTCLHSLGLGSHELQRSGEIDFLLICETGVFVLEVKGGGVTRAGGKWSSIDRYGKAHITSRSPFEQARTAMCELERRVCDHFGRDSRLPRLLFGYGVVAPDCQLRGEVRDHEGGENPLAVYDIDDQGFPFRRYVDRLSQATRAVQRSPRRAPTEKDATQLVDFLRGDFDAVVPLSALADDVSSQMQALEPEQYEVLDGLEDLPRCVIRGAAGTGKTLLALESARRAAWMGRRTLLLCFNKFLAEYLRKRLEELDAGDLVKAFPVHDYLEQLISASPREKEALADAKAAGTADDVLYNKIHPELGALAALETADGVFDTLIVDEAQDVMTSPMLDVFDVVLKGGLADGAWRMFLDYNNQAAIFDRLDEAAFERLSQFGQQQTLPRNCRNTRQIADETRKLTAPKTFAKSRIDGRDVEYIWYCSAEEQLAKTDRVIKRLVDTEKVPPGKITLLSGLREIPFRDGTTPSTGSPVRQLDETTAARLMSGQSDTITCATVSSFKGLENDFVILTNINNLDDSWWRSVCYVGMTRAKAGLYLVLPESLRESCRRMLQNERGP